MAVPPTRPHLRARFDTRRDELVDAAAGLFARQGFAGTSIDEIATVTGRAVGGVYHYVGSKEQLLGRVCERLLDPLLTAVETELATPTDPVERLQVFLHVWVAHVTAHLDHMRVFEQERLRMEDDASWSAIHERRERFELLLDTLLADAERAGGLAHPDRHLARLALLGMVNWLPQWYRPSGRLDPAQIADGFCQLVLDTGARDRLRGSSNPDDK